MVCPFKTKIKKLKLPIPTHTSINLTRNAGQKRAEDQFKAKPVEKNMRRPVNLVLLILISLLFADVYASEEHNPKHFVLVHGACLGAWSWYKLIPPLKSYGHNVTAIDLAASGINLVRVSDIQTFSDYSKPLIDFMESIPSTQKVILVGHSLGGASISQAMELFPKKISVAVFVTATMPGPSLPLSEIAQRVIHNYLPSSMHQPPK